MAIDKVKERDDEEFFMENDGDDQNNLEESKIEYDSSSSSNNGDDEAEEGRGDHSASFYSQQWPQSFKYAPFFLSSRSLPSIYCINISHLISP